MLMSAPLRRLVLTAHVTTSVGWMGAVACFLALAIAGLVNPRPIEVQAAYVAMEMLCWAVIGSLFRSASCRPQPALRSRFGRRGDSCGTTGFWSSCW
jgi:NhaP-type Na+/H+ or K+/H+ antiporter